VSEGEKRVNFLLPNLSLERLAGDCHEVEVTPVLELLVTFGMSWKGVCHELYSKFNYKLKPNSEVTINYLKKAPS
jgi:hypothetical protein